MSLIGLNILLKTLLLGGLRGSRLPAPVLRTRYQDPADCNQDHADGHWDAALKIHHQQRRKTQILGNLSHASIVGNRNHSVTSHGMKIKNVKRIQILMLRGTSSRERARERARERGKAKARRVKVSWCMVKMPYDEIIIHHFSS